MNPTRQEKSPANGFTPLERLLPIKRSEEMRERRKFVRKAIGSGAILLAVGAGITELALDAADHQAQNVQRVSDDARYDQLTHQNGQELPPTITIEKP